MKLIIKAQGVGYAAKLKALEKAGEDMTPVYRVIGNLLITRIRLCFKLGIDPWGNPWAAIKYRAPRMSATGKLSAVGKKQMQANAAGKAGSPLRDTGKLQGSIVPAADSSGVSVGTNLKAADGASYPRALQFGAVIVPKKAKSLAFPGPNGTIVFSKKVVLPARPFLPLRKSGAVELPAAWAKECAQRLKAYFTEAAKAV